jgi:hypothetical protein
MKRYEHVMRTGQLLNQVDRVAHLETRQMHSNAFGYIKYFAYMKAGSVFDLNFVGTDSRSQEEALAFHRKFNLAFCEL